MTNQEFTELLHNRSLKATAPRLALLNALHEYKSAMPYSAIQSKLSPIDRVTLYRTLESLMKKGVIHKAHQEGSDIFYAFCGHSCSIEQHQHNHVHFKCKSCDTVTCEEPKRSLHISLPGYDIQKVSISIEGICKDCITA